MWIRESALKAKIRPADGPVPLVMLRIPLARLDARVVGSANEEWSSVGTLNFAVFFLGMMGVRRSQERRMLKTAISVMLNTCVRA